jgi:hypothetical protein
MKKPNPRAIKGPQKREIPRFKSVQEEAEFWDTHSTEDFDWDDDGEVVDGQDVVVVRQQKKLPMTVRLEPDILTLLTQEARSQGVGPSTMARMAILKYLKDSGRGTMVRRPKTKPTRRKGSRGAA